MNVFALSDIALLKQALQCRCPKCGKGAMYQGRFSLELLERCDQCGFDYSKNDSADGPAVFLIFVLGALLVPLALAFDAWLSPPLWVHGVLWGAVALFLTLIALKPLKSYIIALQYKHRPRDYD